MSAKAMARPPQAGIEGRDQNIKSRFEEHGYIVLPQVLDPEIVARVRREMEALVDVCAQRLKAAGKIENLFEDEPFETRLVRLFADNLDMAPRRFREELHRPGLFDLFFNRKVLDCVESLLGPEIRLYPNYTARPKLPDWAGHLVLWHQDGGYTESGGEKDSIGVDQLRMVNVWSPLVPARVENGCMQFVPGTHRLGVVPHVHKEHYLEISPDYLDSRKADAIDIELDPGDVVLFHNLLFHCGQPNVSKTVRWSLDWRYQDANQPTLRKAQGHLARSIAHPDEVVHSAREWANLTFR